MSDYRLQALRSKSGARDLYKAKKNHKKRPEAKMVKVYRDPKYAKLSIEQYEKKYPTFND